MAATFLTSNDPRLDFFFKVLEDTDSEKAIEVLKASWKFNNQDTLKLLAYLRDIRNGKAIRYQYYVCLLWLYNHHPRTLLKNLSILIECGCWKDPLYLLMMIAFDGKIPKEVFGESMSLFGNDKKKAIKLKTSSEGRKYNSLFYKKTVSKLNLQLFKEREDEVEQKFGKVQVKISKKTKEDAEMNDSDTGEIDESDSMEISEADAKKITESDAKKITESDAMEITEPKLRKREIYEVSRKYMEEIRIKNARDRFNNDKKYRYFHLKIAELFAKQLIDDLKVVNSSTNNDKKTISLAAKWAPSLNGHFDRYLLISSSIALQLAKLTKDVDPNVNEIFSKPIPIATYLARKNYHKNYIVKLRDHLKIPEKFMCSNKWNILPYQMVASKCMQKNKNQFIAHDNDRFKAFVQSREKVAGGALKPAELVDRAMALSDPNELELELLEKQWISLKDSIKLDDKESCFKSALCVCDVSGSMSGTPMSAAIGLTIMTMSFSNEPWSNICITFHENPTFVHLEKNMSLHEKVKKIRSAPWGNNTDLSKTFKLILNLAKELDLKQSEMPKYLFIFTDMEFDMACNESETNFEEAKRLFNEAGYKLPTIIFWNLRSSDSIPVQKGENDTILLAGYSSQQLSLMLNTNIDDITPYLYLDKVLKMKKYEDLVVVD